jgi:hypothetical protein
MLAVFLFLDTYFKHYNTRLDNHMTLKFYCDNSSLLKRITRNQERSWTNPTTCLASDFDLESGIIALLDDLPFTLQFIHVKSHQDNHIEVHLLTWDAQMNVQADHLATDYLENYSDPSKIIPFIPPSQASLNIGGETITRRFAKRLRQAASSPNLRNRMQLRNSWSAQTFQSINWEAPSKALNTLEHNTQICITKFAHEHLPTRKHMKRIGEAESDKCPACLHTIETAWHILSCENRSEWRNSLINKLKETLHVNKTQPGLTLILIQGVRGALHDPLFQMPATNRETRFQYLVTAQNQIGWNHILRGRFSHHWLQLQLQLQQVHIYLDPDTDSTKQSGEIWLKRILNCIWTSLWQVWLIRNDDLHGRDREQREKKRIGKLAPKVVAL